MRVRRLIAAIAVMSLAVVGCTSAGDDGALDLDELEATAAPTEVRPDPPDEEADEPDEPPPDEQHYPPLPPLEPDPDSDLSTETQEFFLELHAGAYETSQRSFATASIDPDLDRYFGGDALAEIEATVATLEERGLVERSPDGEVLWVEVEDLEGGQFRVSRCSVPGPRTGLYDATSGAPEQLVEEVRGIVIQQTYSLTTAGDEVDYRVLSVAAVEDPGRCDAP